MFLLRRGHGWALCLPRCSLPPFPSAKPAYWPARTYLPKLVKPWRALNHRTTNNISQYLWGKGLPSHYVPYPKNTMDHFWMKVDTGRKNDCWNWLGCLRNGYGCFQMDYRSDYSHRFAYEDKVGAIPEGLEIDHLCRNRRCCNPHHMEPVTRAENVLRGFGLGALNKRKTHCHKGHHFDSANTFMDSHGHRQCRICKRERERMAYKRKRAA